MTMTVETRAVLVCVLAAAVTHSQATVTEDLRVINAQLSTLDTRLVQQRVMRRQDNEAIDNKLDKILLKLDNIQKVLHEVKLTGSNREPTARPLLSQEEHQISDQVTTQMEQTGTCSRRSDNKPTLTPVVLWGNTRTLCDTDTDCGGWVVIQRRSKGDVNFYRGWTYYKNGFGTPDTDFWLGLDAIHNLTSQGLTDLRIDLQLQDTRYFAHYSNFRLGPASTSYQLSLGQYYGTAGDSLKIHNGSLFSTFDVDNDKHANNCAQLYHGAWWFVNCYHSNLNGLWGSNTHSGVVWRDLSPAQSLTFTEMKLRRP